MNPLSVTLVQVDSGPVPGPNLKRIRKLVSQAVEPDLIALPEVFAVRGGHADYLAAAEPVPGPLTRALGDVAARKRVWILAGSLIEKAGEAVYNTSVLLDRAGRVAAVYRKLHLFEAVLEDGCIIRESETYKPGDGPVLADIEGWRCGMAICYDLRFPELFRHYSAGGAHLFFVPANFTQRTGQDHWEVLLRARAIENQCFVVAPGQCGTNVRTGITSHGNSMALGPWGDILCRAGDREGILSATLDPAELDRIRARIPVLRHRRPAFGAP
jgi:predicted amidohydrolase